MSAPLSEFRLAQPSTVKEAIAVHLENPGSRFVAGGTDLLVNIRRGICTPPLLIDLAAIEELTGIDTSQANVTIGAGVTIATLARNVEIATRYRALAQAAQAIAGPAHRAMGTVGGNLCLDTRCIYYNQSEWWRSANAYCLKSRGGTCHVAPQGNRCHAAYSGDLAPALLVLGAEVDIADPLGRRRVSLSEIFVEDGVAHLALAKGGLVVALHLPSSPCQSAYEKVRLRRSIDFPLAGVAVAIALSGANLASLRIAITGTNSRPFLLAGTERFAGRAVDETLLQEIDRLVQRQVQPMRTTMAPANYRRIVAGAVARRLTAGLFAESSA